MEGILDEHLVALRKVLSFRVLCDLLDGTEMYGSTTEADLNPKPSCGVSVRNQGLTKQDLNPGGTVFLGQANYATHQLDPQQLPPGCLGHNLGRP